MGGEQKLTELQVGGGGEWETLSVVSEVKVLQQICKYRLISLHLIETVS